MKPGQIAFGILALVITVHIGSIDWHPLMAIPFGVLVGYINFRAILKGKVGKFTVAYVPVTTFMACKHCGPLMMLWNGIAAVKDYINDEDI